ncbi:LysR family transcriptional regulator [Trinickia diaoshuihuensis]|jgi:DNA-binding transcriptional LysR family regulator|uniref:LysR family transcriptional regulator n=1 Tax=Trinickia diaoshuihuensis TaxID=2292265 RepID=UPI000E2507A5|nr:LysR family transcriptional regulator [Trinickia diaoshuihuensis]
MDKIESIRLFTRVVETGSFTAAGKHTRHSTASVSRAISDLETSLRARLLQRNTRNVSVTEPGERYYQRCKRILAELDAAEAEAGAAHTLARGRLRVHSVPDLGFEHVTSAIIEYRRQYPDVTVDLTFMSRHANLVKESVDVSILCAPSLDDSDNVCMLVGECEPIIVATPAFLREHAIETLADLDPHALTPIPVAASEGKPGARCPARKEPMQAGGALVVNDAQAARVAALAGCGAAALPVHCVIEDLRQGKLVQLFPQQRLMHTSIFIVYPSRRYVDAKIKTFVEFLTSRLRRTLDESLDQLRTRTGCERANRYRQQEHQQTG